MLILLLAAAALQTAATAVPEQSAVDAERAFAVNAQRHGQWTAFRMYADRDAVMFTPQVVWAHEFLKDRKDPPVPVQWWPAESYVSCDRRTAVNTGPWVRDGGKSVGYFTTVWVHEKQWNWVYDAGDTLKVARPKPEKPYVRRASCTGTPTQPPLLSLTPPSNRPGQGSPNDYGIGRSADGTLAWDWKVEADGARRFRAFLWNGSHYEQVVYNQTMPQ